MSARSLRRSWRSFARGSSNSTGRLGIVSSRPMFRLASSTVWPRRPSVITQLARRRLSEPPRLSCLLGGLPLSATGGAGARGSSLCAIEAGPSTPVPPLQEGRALLVRARRRAPSCLGRRSQRWAPVVLDRQSCRLRSPAWLTDACRRRRVGRAAADTYRYAHEGFSLVATLAKP